VRACGCSAVELQQLNLSLLSEVVDGKLHAPEGTILRLPAGKGADFKTAYAKLGAGERFASQRAYWIQHRVARGQSIGAIARRYGTTPRAIQSANGLASAHKIRAGQVLRIPRRGDSGAIAVASASRSDEKSAPKVAKARTKSSADKQVASAKSAAVPRASFVSHKVRRGQTIGAIARQYGTTVSAIKSHNGVEDVRRIKIGRVLKIPQS
jgi:membrane-bound lytic murein transglycosylase D